MSDVHVQANPLDGNADSRVKAGSGTGAGVEPMDVELAIDRYAVGALRSTDDNNATVPPPPSHTHHALTVRRFVCFMVVVWLQ